MMVFFRGAPSRKAFRIGVWVVAAVGVMSSAVAVRVVGNAEAAKARDRADEQIRQSMDRLVTAVDLYASVLNDAAALFAASNAVNRSEFRRFYERAAIGDRAEALQGLGFIQRVSAADLAAFVRAQRSDGVPDFAVVPVSSAPEHAVITFNEPAARFASSWGFDAAQIPQARVALDRARDSGKPVLTSRLVLAADRNLPPALQPAGFVLYAPIYAGGVIPATRAERRASLVGWANGPFRAGDFLAGAMLDGSFEVSMYEGSAATKKHLMATGGNSDAAGHVTSRVLAVYGQRWTFTFRTAASPSPWPSASTAGAGVSGLLATGLLLQLIVSIRRNAEKNLDASERVTHEILGQTTDAFVAIDHLGRVVMWNAEAERLFGWRADEVMGLSLTDCIIPEESHHAHRRGIANLSAGGAPSIIGQRVEVEAQHRDGSRIPIELNIWESTFRGEPSFSAFLHDISERRQHANELGEARDKALEATAAKSLFLANVSHEIRTPMSGVLGVTRLLRETSLTPLQSRYVDAALSSTTSLLSILNDLLDAAKIEAGRLDIESLPTDVKMILGEVEALQSLAATAKGISLTFDVDHSVPALVRLDPLRLRQILTNLIGNAVKFTAKGFVRVSVRTVDDVVPQLVFEVEDSGIGMEPEALAHVFEPFRQAERSTTRKFGGTGLGMAISQDLALRMGGEITVTSVAGQGSVFRLTLPADPGDPAPAQPVFDAGVAESVLHPAGIRRVLLAEDNAVSQLVARTLLERQGFIVATATDGAAAVTAVAEGGFDLVLMDCEMPQVDGYEATRRIRTAGGVQPIIVALTASDTPEVRQRCAAAGMDACLAKPIQIQSLVLAVARLTGDERLEATASKSTTDPNLSRT